MRRGGGAGAGKSFSDFLKTRPFVLRCATPFPCFVVHYSDSISHLSLTALSLSLLGWDFYEGRDLAFFFPHFCLSCLEKCLVYSRCSINAFWMHKYIVWPFGIRLLSLVWTHEGDVRSLLLIIFSCLVFLPMETVKLYGMKLHVWRQWKCMLQKCNTNSTKYNVSHKCN